MIQLRWDPGQCLLVNLRRCSLWHGHVPLVATIGEIMWMVEGGVPSLSLSLSLQK